MTKDDDLKRILDRISAVCKSLQSNFDEANVQILTYLAPQLWGLEGTDKEKHAARISLYSLTIISNPENERGLLKDILDEVDRIGSCEINDSRRKFLLGTIGALTALKSSKVFASEDHAILEDVNGRKYLLEEIFANNNFLLFVIAPSISASKKMKSFFEDTYPKIRILEGIKTYKLLALPRITYSFAIGKIRDSTPKEEIPYLLIDWGDKCISKMFKPIDSDEITIVLVDNGKIIYSNTANKIELDFSRLQRLISKA